jgi:thymidylate synthase (FAD)
VTLLLVLITRKSPLGESIRRGDNFEINLQIVPRRIGTNMQRVAPVLFGDYVVTDGTWVPSWRKV